MPLSSIDAAVSSLMPSGIFTRRSAGKSRSPQYEPIWPV
jgi:hypothetical protein